jgi:hypothetical protein
MNLDWKYVKPLKNPEAVQHFELKNAIRIPDSLKKFILEFNGGRPSLSSFDTDINKERVFKTLLSYNEDDIENIYKVIDMFKIGNVLKLLPFASDPFGNYICIDFHQNSIVFWNHETEKTEFISEGFNEFIQSLYE